MKEIFRRLSSTRALLFFAALLFAFPFWVGEAAICSVFASAVLFFALSRIRAGSRRRRLFRLGFWFGFCYHALVYPWLFALYPFEVAHLSKPVAVLVALAAYFGAVAIHALFFALGFLVWGVLGRRLRRFSRAALFCAVFVVAEYLKELGTLALPWSRIGLPLANYPVTIAISALLGPYFVDLILLFLGASLYGVFTCRAKKRLVCAALSLVCLGFDLGYGIGKGLTKLKGAFVRVAVVQTNYPSAEKWDTDLSVAEGALERLAVQAASEGAEWIVFPESVLPERVRAGSGSDSFFARLSKKTGAVLVAGAICSDGEDTYNAVCVYDETGMLGYNGKRHLVPFGEYLPWQSAIGLVLPEISNMTYYRNTYTPGKSGIAGVSGSVTAGGLVCFDSLFSVLSCESARQGANLLFVATNDSWFRTSRALQHHLWQGVFRAAETDRAVAQAANCGLSALISRGGAHTRSLAPACEGVLVEDLELSDAVTPYTRVGDLIVLLCAIVVSCFALLRAISALRRRRKR